MSDAQGEWRSDNPNAPKISYKLYVLEKATFAGTLVGSILYGILIVLFFQCIVALFNPVYRKRDGIKWGLVSYTVAMFSFVTVHTTMHLNNQSVSFIDNRDFTGPHGALLGPYGYWQSAIRLRALGMVPNLMYLLNNLLADGLLIYRCYVIYSRNIWVVALPCLLYLATLATGTVVLVYQSLGLTTWAAILTRFGVPYFSVSVSLNVLLTLTIVIQLALRSRNIRNATKSPTGISGIHRAIATMLIESCALFAVSSVLVIGFLVAGNCVADTFLPILTESQAIAPLLIIQRVANKNALASRTIVTGRTSSFNVGNRGDSAGNDGVRPDGYHLGSVDKYGNVSGELEVRVETTVDFHRDSTGV